MEAAVREFKRVLQPGGDLFITVPYGKPRDFTHSRIFTKELVSSVMAAFSPVDHEMAYYFYDGSGWQVSTEPECAAAEYEEWCMQPPPQPPFPARADGLAAAQAVVCMRLVK